jgi:hypothetical protein
MYSSKFYSQVQSKTNSYFSENSVYSIKVPKNQFESINENLIEKNNPKSVCKFLSWNPIYQYITRISIFIIHTEKCKTARLSEKVKSADHHRKMTKAHSFSIISSLQNFFTTTQWINWYAWTHFSPYYQPAIGRVS